MKILKAAPVRLRFSPCHTLLSVGPHGRRRAPVVIVHVHVKKR